MASTDRIYLLRCIKGLHTAVWALMAGSILAIPFAAAQGAFQWAAALSGLLALECLILAVNRGRCPLTDLAARFTAAREDNFDIYLPLWLARYNKVIFGSLFVAAELFTLALWLTRNT